MKAKRIFFVLCILALLSASSTFSASSAPLTGGEKGQVEQTIEAQAIPVNQIIVKYKSSANLVQAEAAQTPAQMQRLSETAGMTLTYFRSMSGDAHVLRLAEQMPVSQALEITAKLATLPEVEFAEPDYVMQPIGNPSEGIFAVPNDPQYANQWHYFAPGAGHYGVNAPAAWDITTGSASIYAAVIDTGILNHADLSGRWIGGYDFISDTATANDGGGRDASPLDPGDWVIANECYAGSAASNSSWHGTHVAGTIGAASNNSTGVAGLNWVSKVVPLRVLGKCGGFTSDIADAMRWAAGLSVAGVPANAYPAKVINMSLGGYSPSGCPAAYQTAANDVVAAGSTLIVAAGNSNANASLYAPSNCANVITIAATNRDGGRAYYSNYGTAVEVAAPGGAQAFANDSNGVLSTLNTGTTTPGSDAYVYYQGTSMAAPHVTGVVSLMYSVNSSLTSAQVLSFLQSTVTTFPTGTGADCTTSTCGSGIVNAPAAIAAAQVPVSSNKLYLPIILRMDAPPPVSSLVNGNFESGSGVGWTESSTHGWPIVINTGFPGGLTPHGGSWAAWLGGDISDISYVQQPVTIPVGTPYLAYYHWISSVDTCGFDYGLVLVNGTEEDSYDLCTTANTGGWVRHTVNLSAYAGQTVTLQIRAETDGSLNSNLFVDDVSFAATASSVEPLVPLAPNPLNSLSRNEVFGR
jgi:serine protease